MASAYFVCARRQNRQNKNMSGDKLQYPDVTVTAPLRKQSKGIINSNRMKPNDAKKQKKNAFVERREKKKDEDNNDGRRERARAPTQQIKTGSYLFDGDASSSSRRVSGVKGLTLGGRGR
jgi:hypothetical protein